MGKLGTTHRHPPPLPGEASLDPVCQLPLCRAVALSTDQPLRCTISPRILRAERPHGSSRGTCRTAGGIVPPPPPPQAPTMKVSGPEREGALASVVARGISAWSSQVPPQPPGPGSKHLLKDAPQDVSGGFGWDPPPSSEGPPLVPAEGGPTFFKLKSSWHRRRRGKILAVSPKHWKGRRG